MKFITGVLAIVAILFILELFVVQAIAPWMLAPAPPDLLDKLLDNLKGLMS